jgi:sulfur-oxidizing protein SoxZ
MAKTFTKNSLRIRISHEKNGEQVFKTIITHPMETGYRRDSRTGETIAADYIEDLRISVDGKTYFAISLGENVSSNPFLSFVFARPLVDNQLLRISWVDNHQRDTAYDCPVSFGQDGMFHFEGEKQGSDIVHLLPEAGTVCKTKTPGAGQ